MRPILYSKNETRFDTYGLGEIDALKGNATRERNGNYSAYLEYPASGPLASVFEKEMKFKADAGTRTKNQTFEIVRVAKDSSSTIKIYAQHISHKLEYMSVRHGIKVSGTADLALRTWAKNLVGDYHFDTWSDIDTVLPITFLVDKMENARLALGGVEGSILDIWGGEYEFDNQTVRLHKRLGRRAPTVLEYGRNILSAESDESIESAYTSVVPFATYTPESLEGDSRQQDPVLVTIPESYVDSKYVSMYANRRIKVVDFSSEFKDEGVGESKKKGIPTPEKLRALAIKYMENNRIGVPKINTKIEYVDLAQTLDYAERGWIEELELCDIVPVYYPQIGITEDDAKVTKVVYDFLNDRNESVEFGMVGESIRSAMTGGLAGRLDDLEKSQQSLENRQSEMAFKLPKYLLDAKGNRVWNGTPDKNIEHKVGDIWFEKNGLYQRLYIWNGEMWEKRIDTEDVSKVGEKFDAEIKKINQSMTAQSQKIAQALESANTNASAIEAAKGSITKLNQDLTGAKTDLMQAQSQLSGSISQIRSDVGVIRMQQTTYEQSNEQNLARITGQLGDKASKTEVKQTADRIREEIASVQTGSSRNYFRDSRTQSFTTNSQATYDYRLFIAPDFWKNKDRFKRDYVRLSFDVTFPVALARDMPAMVHFGASPWYAYRNLVFKGGTTKRQHFEFTIDLSGAAETYWANNVFIRFGTNYGFPAGLQVVIENAVLSVGNYYPVYQPAYEDQEVLITEAKASFERTAQGLRTDLIAVQSYVSADGARAEALQKYSREETARQVSAFRQMVTVDYVAKAQHTEDVRGLTNRFEELKTNSEAKLAEYKQSVEGRFATIAQQIAGKASQTEFQRVRETSKLYERLIGSTEADIPNKVSRMVMTNELFQVEVSKNQGLRTVQSQLAGSWAVQNLNSAGDLISGLNLGANGVNRLDGRLTHITGQTLIDNAVIKSAMIESVLADKVTTGTLNAANVNIINLNANKIAGLDATFLRGKIENAIIDWLVGKTLISQNGSTTLNLQTGKFTLDDEHSSITFRRSSDNTKTEFNKDGITFLQNQKVIAFLGQGYNTSIYENSTQKCFRFGLPSEQGLAFTTHGNSTFFEINPQKKNLSIQSEFTLLIGGKTSQSVSLEHRFGNYNGVNFSSFRAKGTDNQELRFYADGRIEITRG